MLKHCASNRKRRLSAFPNVGLYITTLKFLALQAAPHIYDISRLKVKWWVRGRHQKCAVRCAVWVPADQLPQHRSNPQITACNETDLMHFVSSVYSVTTPLHISGLLVAHHQGVTIYTCICNKWYVLYVLVDCQLAWLRCQLETIKTETCRGIVTK
jgi:hypothetical protein